MKKILLFFAALINFLTYSQLTVNNTQTPEQLVQNILAGPGVVVSNVTFNGDPIQIGSFGGSSNIGFGSGLILASGDINDAIGPNNQGGAGSGTTDNNDPDLDIIVDPNGTFDASILEFDFIPISDTVKFNYVFGSEEYLEFVNGGVNDAFGFFISGPGINGPFSNNAENIALIPGTAQFVTIDNVNDVSNGQFYFDNENPPGQTVQYDGFTVPLQAISGVQCGQTYHLKIAIADAGDGVWDSGVFLQAGSLSSVGLEIDLETVTGDTIIYENCTSAEFIFSRPLSLIADSAVINYVLTGTAIEGIDFTSMIDSIVFVPGEDTVIISLNALQDGILEGNETVIITATLISECGDTIIKTKSLTISEDPIFDATVNAPEVFCPNDSVYMTVAALGGTPPYIYTWENGEIGDSVPGAINGVGIQTYTVNIVDLCGFTFQDSVTITQSPPPAINMVLADITVTCIETDVFASAFPTGGVDPLTITWSNGDVGNFSTLLTAGNPTYTITVTDDCGNQITDDIAILPAPDPIITITPTNNTVSCPDNNVQISALASNGFAPYTYAWDNGSAGSTITVPISIVGTLNFNVTATDVCGNVSLPQLVTVTLVDPPVINLALSAPEATCIEDSVLMTSISSGGSSSPLTITWSNGQTGAAVFGLTSGAQTYTATASDDCGNSFSQTITILDAPDPILTIVAPDVTIACPSNSVALNATASNGFTPYIYAWTNTTSTGPQITVSALTNGSQNFDVTATDICGNTITETVTLTLNQLLNIDNMGQVSSVFCAPTGVANASVTGNVGNTTFTWSGPGTNGPIINNALSATNLTSGWYYFTVQDAVCQDADSVFVEVLDEVVANFAVSSIVGTLPQTVIFSNSSLNANSFDWNFGNGDFNNSVDISNQSSIYTISGTYTVELIAFQGICSDTATLEIEVIADPTIHLPNIFTPNGDLANEGFTLDPQYFKTFTFIILNRWGNVMFEGDLVNHWWNGMTTDNNPASPGTYFYTYTGEALNGEIISGEGLFQLVR